MRQIVTIVFLLLLLTIVGTVGFRIMTGGGYIECLYLAVITITTVGSSEPAPLTDGGRLFVVAYLCVSLSIFSYSLYQTGQWVMNTSIRGRIERRKMEKRIGSLHNHYIVCGFGRMGRTICEYLHERRRTFVVIDVDGEMLSEACAAHGWLYVVGDATDDEVLRKAGVPQAQALATVLPTDADNVYVVLSASMLAPELQIISRASTEKAVQKMEHAGASRVISPFSSGAIKIARFMLSPSLEDFIEVADASGVDLELCDIQITEESPYVGKPLTETDLRSRGVMIVGIRRASGERLMPPSGDAVIEAGDSLFAFGNSSAVQTMLAETTATPE